MRRNLAHVIAAAALTALAGLGPHASIARADSPWDRGSISLSVALGSDQRFGENYFLFGAGAAYFVLPGVAVGLHGVRWFGGDPSITAVSPEVRYVAVPLGWPVLPYVGGFYTHYFIGDPFIDLDTVGARLGLVFHQGGGLVLGGGAALERTVTDCSEDCTSIYPELTVGITF